RQATPDATRGIAATADEPIPLPRTRVSGMGGPRQLLPKYGARMLVICAGMCRSGSTWQYLVACDLLERTGPGERLGFLTPPEFARASAEPPAGRWRVLKTHDGHPAFAAVLATGQARCLYAYRDLRDVAYSLAHKWSVPLRTAVVDRAGVRNCIANQAFWVAQPHG